VFIRGSSSWRAKGRKAVTRWSAYLLVLIAKLSVPLSVELWQSDPLLRLQMFLTQLAINHHSIHEMNPNVEKISQSRMPLPRSETKNLTETDVAIIRALSRDSRKSAIIVAKELGLSTKTVRKRVDRLRRANTIFTFPILNLESLLGHIPIYISYVYTNKTVKSSVDRAIFSHFDTNYLIGSFSDPDFGNVVLGASKMADAQKFLEWTKSQPGIASTRADIPIETLMFPKKLINYSS
jgi:hypothetical protein